ncbi:MAG: hypothetical protein QOE97_741 [Pseudonocardiales bacterium]|nr:hypothetical protein [Pseudonocardiales bacterium]
MAVGAGRVVRGAADADGVGVPACVEVCGAEDPVDAAGELAGGVDGVAATGLPACVEVHAVSITSAPAVTARTKRTGTGPECHATPMRILGWVAGVSHCMIDTRLPCGIATQPAVGPPSVTCRKNAEPCGYAVLPEGVLMTTA